MKTKKRNVFLSLQVKEALFHSIYKAKQNELSTVTLKTLFYGIIKVNKSLLKQIIKKFFKKNIHLDTKLLLYRCEIALSKEIKQDQFNTTGSNVILNKSVRNLLYSLIVTAKNNTNSKKIRNGYIVITTFSIFIALIKNKSIQNWLKDEIFILKK